MTDLPARPKPPKGAKEPDALNALYQAELESWKVRARDPVEEAKRIRIRDDEEAKRIRTRDDARADTALAVAVARQDADRAAEVALLQSMQNAYVEVAKSSLDRSITRANFMTGLIAAISGTYTTLLALVYGIGENPVALPGRAMIPVVFLGIALVLASFYVAFLRRNVKKRNLLPSGIGGTIADERLKTFLDWVFSGVLERAWALRTSIVAFGIGVALLPLPFLNIDVAVTRDLTIAAGVALVAWLGGEIAYRERKIKGEGYIPDPPTASLGEA